MDRELSTRENEWNISLDTTYNYIAYTSDYI